MKGAFVGFDADQAGTSNDPKLAVTHIASGAGIILGILRRRSA